MTSLAAKAENRATRSCRGTNGQTTGSAPEPSEPAPAPAPAPTAPTTTGIQLRAGAAFLRDSRYYVVLTWSGASGARVDLYRNGDFRRETVNSGRTTILVRPSRTAQTVEICETSGARCSNTVTVQVN